MDSHKAAIREKDNHDTTHNSEKQMEVSDSVFTSDGLALLADISLASNDGGRQVVGVALVDVDGMRKKKDVMVMEHTEKEDTNKDSDTASSCNQGEEKREKTSKTEECELKEPRSDEPQGPDDGWRWLVLVLAFMTMVSETWQQYPSNMLVSQMFIRA